MKDLRKVRVRQVGACELFSCPPLSSRPNVRVTPYDPRPYADCRRLLLDVL
jgi:hypothetical protein